MLHTEYGNNLFASLDKQFLNTLFFFATIQSTQLKFCVTLYIL